MRVYDAKNIRYKDGLAEKRRKVFVVKVLFFIGLVIAVAGLILYLLFFSGFLDIREVSISGLDKVGNDEFNSGLNNRLNSKWLGLLEHQRNILFFNSKDFKAEALASFPEIKGVSINKEPPHTLEIDITEREMAGIWCFSLPSPEEADGGCRYFDMEGNLWGEAARSSGFIVLNVSDLRPDIKTIDFGLLATIIFTSNRLKEMDILVSKFTIPKNFIGNFSATTSSGYELLFSTDFDIGEQLKVLEIFLAEKQNDPWSVGGFKPQYIDLRINGRVYYK